MFGSALQGTAFAILNEILGTYRGKDGIARPSRYEVVLLPPTGSSNNKMTNQMQGLHGDNTVRKTSLKITLFNNLSFSMFSFCFHQ